MHPPGPVINENCNAYSRLTIGVAIENTGDVDVNVVYLFEVVAKDYRGFPLSTDQKSCRL